MSDDFDWSTLIHLLANQPIVSADLENNRDLILLEHQLYGIDAPTMKTLVLRSIDLQTNHFNRKNLSKLLRLPIILSILQRQK